MKRIEDFMIAAVALILFASFFIKGWLSVGLSAVAAILAVVTMIMRKK